MMVKFFTAVTIALSIFMYQNEVLTYKQVTGDEIETFTYTIIPTQTGYSVKLKRSLEQKEINEEYEVDTKFSTVYWKYLDTQAGTEVRAFREENIILLSGKHKEEPIEEKFKINDLPWKQLFSLDFELYAQSGEKEMKFWSIGTSGPGDMKCTTFSAKIQENESITVNNNTVDAIYVRVAMTSWKSRFWHGKFWFRKSDGRFVKYRGKNSPFAPESVKEITW